MSVHESSYRTSRDVHPITVNALPAGLAPDRCRELLTAYSWVASRIRRCGGPVPGTPPIWYLEAIIAALETRVRGQEVMA